jgi:hypothetical protein
VPGSFLGAATRAQPQPVPPEKLQPLVQNVFYGNVGNISENGEHFTQTASVGVQPQDLGKPVTEFANHLDELKLDGTPTAEGRSPARYL